MVGIPDVGEKVGVDCWVDLENLEIILLKTRKKGVKRHSRKFNLCRLCKKAEQLTLQHWMILMMILNMKLAQKKEKVIGRKEKETSI